MIKVLLSLLMMASTTLPLMAAGVEEASTMEQRAQKFTMVYISGTQKEVKRDIGALYGNYVIPAHNAAIEALNTQKDAIGSSVPGNLEEAKRGVASYFDVLAAQKKVVTQANAFAKQILAAQKTIPNEGDSTIQFMHENTAYAIICDVNPNRENHHMNLLLNNEDYPLITDKGEMRIFLENKGYQTISDEDVADALQLYQAASQIFIQHMKVL